jgi:hypothetical protein
MIFRRIMFVLLTTLVSSALYSQHGLKLDKNIKLDTLRIWITYPDDFEKDLVMKFDSIFERAISRFNEDAFYFVEIDSTNPDNRIIMKMESLKYVDTKRNILSAGLSLALIGGHIIMISSYAWTIPVWPILLPATVSKINLQIDKNMIISKPESRTWISSNGFLMNKEKQTQKFESKFDKDIYRFLKKLINRILRITGYNTQHPHTRL